MIDSDAAGRVFLALALILMASPTVQAQTAPKPMDWSPKRACSNLFLPSLSRDEISAVAYSARATIENKADATAEQLEQIVEHAFRLFQASSFLTPQIDFFVGPATSGKTHAVVHGFLPVLRTQHVNSVYLDASSYLANAKASLDKGDGRPSYDDFTLVVLDGVDFSNLSFDSYKQFLRFTSDRYQRGLSTLILTKGDVDKDDLTQFTADASGGVMPLSMTEFKARILHDTTWRKP